MQKYRADIDGLRALAVIPVVFFHARIPGFTGGFVGVDVFFVISGYLITIILYSDIQEGRYSISSFYERRVRRILPALFFVLIVSTLAAGFILLPDELAAFGKSVIATMLFLSNVFFWRESGYFDSAAEAKPLLHTWSLAVEEQFYIVFPIVLWLCYRYLPRRLPALLFVIALGSLLLSIVAEIKWPVANFYLPFSRAWELLLGSLLAVGSPPPLSSERTRNLVGASGVAAILLPVFTYDGSTPFPGLSALPPTMGTAAILYAGANGTSFVSSMLSRREIVFVGLISYSLYLWHWPVLVFSRMAALHELTLSESALAIAASVALATFSWHFVERPFRVKALLKKRVALFHAAAFSTLAFAGIGVVFFLTAGLPQRLPASAVNTFSVAAEKKLQQERYGCAVQPLVRDTKYGSCQIGADAGAPQTLIWGDSHAMALAPMFDTIFEQHNIPGALISLPGCPPAFRIERDDYQQRPCGELTSQVAEFIRKHGIRRVILVAYWTGYLQRMNTSFEGRLRSCREGGGNLKVA